MINIEMGCDSYFMNSGPDHFTITRTNCINCTKLYDRWRKFSLVSITQSNIERNFLLFFSPVIDCKHDQSYIIAKHIQKVILVGFCSFRTCNTLGIWVNNDYRRGKIDEREILWLHRHFFLRQKMFCMKISI